HKFLVPLHRPGNQAFHDQILALQWVQKNIAFFGDGPKWVTVFGVSAGANSIRVFSQLHLYSDSTRASLARVIRSISSYHIPQSATKLTSYFMVSLGCNLWSIACARSNSTNEILQASIKAGQLALNDDPWTTFGLVERLSANGDLIPADSSTFVKSRRYNTKAGIMCGTIKN
ncbi:hypothetical protein BGZ47_010419, partial [Haplosporangium gracile]